MCLSQIWHRLQDWPLINNFTPLIFHNKRGKFVPGSLFSKMLDLSLLNFDWTKIGIGFLCKLTAYLNCSSVLPYIFSQVFSTDSTVVLFFQYISFWSVWNKKIFYNLILSEKNQLHFLSYFTLLLRFSLSSDCF